MRRRGPTILYARRGEYHLQAGRAAFPGHTGRPLETPHYLALAFALILLAGVIRAALPAADTALTLLSWRVSAVLWIVVLGMFLYRYLQILTRPGVDGGPG